MNNIKIRKMLKGDIKYLREIFYNVRKDNFNWINRRSLSLLDLDKSIIGEEVFVAYIENEVIGFCSVWVEDKFIHNLFIKPSFQGKGVGKSLIDEVYNEYGDELTLKCVKANKKAVDFYIKNSWEILEEGFSDDGEYYLMAYKNSVSKI